MHPSAARRYSNLCHLQTFCPFLSFPSISEPGCQLTGEKPISQSSFFPFPWEASPPGCPHSRGRGYRPPCQRVPHHSSLKEGLAPRAAQTHLPDQAFPQGSCPISHTTATRRDGRAGPACRDSPSSAPASRGALNPRLGT